MYGIIHKETKKYFAGFNGLETVWTDVRQEAWKNTHMMAKAQASLLACNDVKIQKKPVTV